MHHRNRRDLLGCLVVASVALASVCNGFVVRCTRLPSRLDQIPLFDPAAAAVSTRTANSARRTRPRRNGSLRDLTCLTKIPRWANKWRKLCLWRRTWLAAVCCTCRRWIQHEQWGDRIMSLLQKYEHSPIPGMYVHVQYDNY